MKRLTLGTVATYLILLLWSLVVLFPLYTMVVNSVKPSREIFRNPFNIYLPPTFDGFVTAWTGGRFDLYYRNSIFVTLTSLLLIVFLGSLAAYALANWHNKFATYSISSSSPA